MLEKNNIKLILITIILAILPLTVSSKTFSILLSNSKNSELYYKYQNNTKIDVLVKKISGENNIIFLQNFHSGWYLYINNNQNFFCNKYKENNSSECYPNNKIQINDLSYLYKKPIFQDSHKLAYDYANQWTIDPEYIKKNFDKSYYKENPDGSIDIELTLYFKPQSYFYLGLIISGTTLVGCITYLIIDGIKNRKKKVDIIELQTNSEDIKK